MTSVFLRIYNLGVFLYTLGISLAAPYNGKAKKWVEGRKKQIPTPHENRPLIWMHCASAGEFEQGRPVLQNLKNEFPRAQICVSFYSSSGYEFHREDRLPDFVFYLPSDTPKRMSNLVDQLDPDLFIGVKYEFWYHLFNELHKREIPTIVVGAIFDESQHYFNWTKNFWLNLFSKIDLFFVQNTASTKVLRKFGISQTVLAGDPRRDQVLTVASEDFDASQWRSKLLSKPILVAGSTWPEDDKILMNVAATKTDWSFAIVPHEIEETHLLKWEERFPGECIRSSESKRANQPARILLVDQMGVLSRLYRIGKAAYIGGGFGKGIHNILEPAAYGVFLQFGPKHDGFQEAIELIDLGAAASINNSQELISNLALLSEGKFCKEVSEIQKNYFDSRNSPAKIIVQKIKEEFGPRLT